MKPRTLEYLYVLNSLFIDLKVEVVLWESDNNTGVDTSWYEVYVYSIKEVEEEIKESESESLSDFQEDGIAAVIGLKCVAVGETLDEAIENRYEMLLNKLN